MPRLTQINTGVIVRQDQNNSNPVILPSNSISSASLSAGTRLAMQNATLTVALNVQPSYISTVYIMRIK